MQRMLDKAGDLEEITPIKSKTIGYFIDTEPKMKKKARKTISLSKSKKEVQKTIYLKNTEDNHYKFYNISIIKEHNIYSVESHWGRIGNKGRKRIVNICQNHIRAGFQADKLAKEKMSKGYKEVTGSIDPTTSESKTEVEQEKAFKRFIDLLE